ncbi:hypothetical protein COBT_000118 [Conglomerata obtusa]
MAFETNVKYNINGIFPASSTLSFEKSSIRFTEPDVITEKSKNFITSVEITKSDEKYYKIAFTNGKYLCKKDIKLPGVITCDANGKLIDWEIVEIGNGLYKIKNQGDCLKVFNFDDKLKGYYVHASTCKDEPNEHFKIVPVVEKATQVQPTEVQPTQVQPTQVQQPIEQSLPDNAITQPKSPHGDVLETEIPLDLSMPEPKTNKEKHKQRRIDPSYVPQKRKHLKHLSILPKKLKEWVDLMKACPLYTDSEIEELEKLESDSYYQQT